MKVRYGLVGFGGLAENRVAKEGFACDSSRFAPLKKAQLVGATDLNPARQKAGRDSSRWRRRAELFCGERTGRNRRRNLL